MAPLALAVSLVLAPLALAVSLVLAPLAVGPGDPAPPGPGLRFVDVGQGAALLIVGREGHAALVDAGPPGGSEALVHALAQHELFGVDLWVVTHFDSDHVGGFARALAGADALADSDDDVTIGERWDRGLDSPPATAAVEAWLAASAPRRAVGAGDRWTAPGLEIAVVPAGSAPERAAENARSLALCVTLEGLRLLVAGDLPAEQVAAAAAACGPVDVLWASHHGSRTGISLDVLAAAAPALVVVSAGTDNAFCHPQGETLELLQAYEVWATGLAGAAPHGDCPGVAPRWGPAHRLAGGDVWVPADARTR